MKVLFISTSSGSRGGGELYILKLGEKLQSLGHKVYLACSDHIRMEELAKNFSAYGDVLRFRYKNTYDHNIKSLSYLFKTTYSFPELESFCEAIKPDVIHLNKQNIEDGLDLLYWTKKQPLPNVQTIHILRSPSELGARFGFLRDRVSFRYIEQHAIPTILVASKPEREMFHAKNLVPKDYTRHIANGVKTIHNEILDESNHLSFLAVSRLHSQKRPLLWLDWAKQLEDKLENCKFSWIGNGLIESTFLEKSKSIGLKKLHYHGWQADPRPFYQNADYLLHSAEYEGQPFAILEAFSAGIPAIVDDSFIQSQPELAPALIPISKALEYPKSLADSEFKSSLSSIARKLYKDYFSADLMAESTLSFYREVTAPHIT